MDRFPLQEHGVPACSLASIRLSRNLRYIISPWTPYVPYDLQTRRPQMPALIIPIRMPAEADLLKPY